MLDLINKIGSKKFEAKETTMILEGCYFRSGVVAMLPSSNLGYWWSPSCSAYSTFRILLGILHVFYVLQRSFSNFHIF